MPIQKIFTAVLFVFSFAAISVQAKEVVFEIPAGAYEDSIDWNTEDDPVIVEVGDTLRVVNLDSEVHAVHTAGSPFPHTSGIQPGEELLLVIKSSYNSFTQGHLRDHYYNAQNEYAKFWLVAE